MKRRYVIAAVVLILAAVAGGIATATVAGNDEGDATHQEPLCGDLAGVCGSTGEPMPPEIILDDAGGNNPAESAERFVGLTASEATGLAEDEGRPWRISRTDDEQFVLTDDLVAGRVTFEIDEGTVTSAFIERGAAPPQGIDIVEDPARADLVASSVQRLLTVDNGFGGVDVFDDIRVARVIGADPDQPLHGLDRDMIAAALSELGAVRYIDDADAEIEALFEASPTGVAVVSVERVLLLDDRAEVEMRLWCGSLCGVFLTYEAAPHEGGWDITGIIGPIAMS